MSVTREDQRGLLLRVAKRAMAERGFESEFPAEALAEAAALPDAPPAGAAAEDLAALPWCSIDNDDSRDLDQLTVAEALDGGRTRLSVAIADVSARVSASSAMERHARTNTTSVYTPPRTFPMLPERLSTDLTSLVEGEDRLAIVVRMEFGADGKSGAAGVSRARVRNHAKLAYSQVGPWLEGGKLPARVAAVPGLAENLKLQDRIAQRLKQDRHEHGALELETVEAHARFDGDVIAAVVAEPRNRAKELIEDCMIATNGVIASWLAERRFPVVRRIVQSPERWPRIAEIALGHGARLPEAPDVRALHQFLIARRAADPATFPDLSLAIVKLLGGGSYAVSFPGDPLVGHFGLAVSEYTHSTAPNRRYPDLLTQRLLGAALEGRDVPYAREDLEALAATCTRMEDGAKKVERLMRKAAAATWLAHRIGEEFSGIVTGASSKGTWARIVTPPVEGRIERGAAGLDVGDHVRLKLLGTDPERGFIDFARLDSSGLAPRH